MKIGPECIPCILKVVVSAIRQLGCGDDGERDLLARALEVPSLRGQDWGKTPPETIEQALVVLSDHSGHPDPFHKIKKRQNEEGLRLLPRLREEAARASSPLRAAVKMAAAGNAIDLMTNPEGTIRVDQVIRNRLAEPFPEGALDELVARLRSSRRIVWFADNCGEVVFDRVLAERLAEETGAEITYVVRGQPALNDVTQREAVEVGMNEVCRIIPNGIAGPLPGTILSRCSAEVRRRVAEADLLLSKGGGNFESLDETGCGGRPPAFLLQTKCRLFQERFGTAIDEPILHLVTQD